MSSDLYVYGTFSFPKGKLHQWMQADLPSEDEDEEDDDFGVTFSGASEHKTVEEAFDNLDDAGRFLALEEDGDNVLIRGVLGDDSWCPWTTTLGAMARAAAALGATGHIEVLDDSSYCGKLIIKDKTARFDAKAKQTDRAGEKDLFARYDAWLKKMEERYKRPKNSATKPAKKSPAKKPAAKKISTK